MCLNWYLDGADRERRGLADRRFYRIGGGHDVVSPAGHYSRNRIYINQPDYYFLVGGNKTGMGYRETN